MSVEPDFASPEVSARFAGYPQELRERLLDLRALIFAVAEEAGAETVTESLKWNQPSYATPKGTPVRLDAHGGSDDRFAFYVHCQTDLVERYRQLHGDRLACEGNRAVVFDCEEPLPEDAVRHCFAMALTYRRDK